MASQTRSARLDKFLNHVLSGKRPIATVDSFTLLLEAIQEQSDHAVCIERIIASPAAKNAIHAGLRFDISSNFINRHTSSFINYLAEPSVKSLCGGQFLHEMLKLIVEPRTIWNAFTKAFFEGHLTDSATQAFSWMLIELLMLPPTNHVDVKEDAQRVVDDGSLLRATTFETRSYGRKLKQILEIQSNNTATGLDLNNIPGGRHDNDHADFRQIAIYPTFDEFRSDVKPFYRRAEEVLQLPIEIRPKGHLDNQFRLLREDMLSEIREEFKNSQGQKKRRLTASLLKELSLVGVFHGTEHRQYPCGLVISCSAGLGALTCRSPKDKKAFLKNEPGFLRHQSFGCLLRQGEIVSFAMIDRQADLLLKSPPEIVLRVIGEDPLKKALMYFKLYDDIQFLLVDAPVFAYEPILRCLQEKQDLPLSQELLEYQPGSVVADHDTVPLNLIHAIRNNPSTLQDVLNTKKPISLDPSQLESLTSGLTQRVSLIQGPPGTGKSFVGALLAKAIHDHSIEKILVMCYTNHALDQFLEDLLDIGIDPSKIVRLGSKSSVRTARLSLFSQKDSGYRRNAASWGIINNLEEGAKELSTTLAGAFQEYLNFKLNIRTILEFLEFEKPEFFLAFTPPEQDNKMTLVGEGGKSVTSQYLYNRWSLGKGHSMPNLTHLGESARQVWEMDIATRQAHIQAWARSLFEEHAASVQHLISRMDKSQEHLDRMWNEKTRYILESKRIIGCTTTAAAKNARDLVAVSPGVVLLEEAGEILESHVLTAVGPQTKQLIMIGDHQQLRPKINNYALSVEKGAGYDLNRSLFERLVEAGYPHCTLAKQHRMVPQISSLIRKLTYPNLQDDQKTLNRPAPRGLQDRVIFIDHRHPEDTFRRLSDRRDEGSKGSKQNAFEADFVLKIVRYLGQQGYGTNRLVVLTPYLGQLHVLRDKLSKETDPVLSDLDTYDLIMAGLMSHASAQHVKRPIRLSTIDNYQGEESDIVIATLTRSNDDGDIGFMASPQRLNVLLSRARDILIMIGNSKTFLDSRKGKDFWKPFIDQLQENGHLYDGLPVHCEQHRQRKEILRTVNDFDNLCPDGGCQLPCGTKLSCGIHECPHKCHQLSDHSKMLCLKITDWTCSRNHRITKPCFQQKQICHLCIEVDKETERRRSRDMKLDAKREQQKKAYKLRLAEIQDEIDHERRLQKDATDEKKRQLVLQQHLNDLEKVKNNAIERAKGNISTTGQPNKDNSLQLKDQQQPDKLMNRDASNYVSSADNISLPSSTAEEWEYQKEYEGAKSEELDTLMGMIGLESIKQKFLAIKDQVDTALRQNVDFKGERFGSVLIGNPGTGKTTVARLYAKFLTSMGILPGSFIIETTGSRLANEGVSGCEKQLNNILNNGGGVLFIDEAYQLAQGSGMGAQVLEYLLAEVERLTGKIVFVLAGYRSNMEKFFAHNQGLPSRFPLEFSFEDYSEKELTSILAFQLNKKYGGRMKVEGAIGGLYCRIVARRIGRQRGHEGFGNARTVENVLSRIIERQASRLSRDRRNRSTPDDLLLTKEDLIGPEPSQALENCAAWRTLKNMIGLDAVKDTVQALLDSLQSNYERELREEPLVEFTLNRVFLGSPGTGKTTVAKLYGQILVDIGYLSNGEVVVKNPADFVGSALGQSEQNTKGILASTIGKVLVIDEAYGLFGGGSRNGGAVQADPYKTAVVDTIVAEVQSSPGDDRCVLLLGYQEQMTEMFQNVNPGLSRRFPLESAFVFEDFSDDELGKILDMKMKQQGFVTSEAGKKVGMEILARARNRPHFGNAGEIDILLNGAKVRQQKRRSTKSSKSISNTLEPRDFDPDYDRGESGGTNIPLLFQGVVGCDQIVNQLQGYCQTVTNMRQLDMDPREQVPFNFLFRGPPGTGKTTTARKMGKVYYDMGLLSSAEVIESSATDLVGQYVGQTGPKAQALLEKALGKILLIDEAYRLTEGPFAKEAMDEIVDCITKPKFFQKLIIILAGYDKDINRLMAINPGLTSRFPESLEFKSLGPDDCIQLLTNLLQKRKQKLLPKLPVFDLSVLESPSLDFKHEMAARFSILIQSANWANARDIQTLEKAIFGKAIKSLQKGGISVPDHLILGELEKMIEERTGRSTTSLETSIPAVNPHQAQAIDHQPTQPVLTTRTTAIAREVTKNEEEDEEKESSPTPSLSAAVARDAGVSDEVWNQLEKDKQKAMASEAAYQRLREEEESAQKAVEELEKSPPDNSQSDDESKRQHELRRLEELARRAKLDELQRRWEDAEAARRQEQKVQQKLRHMGVCVAGYKWVRTESGYRCAGGSHFVSNKQLEI